MTGGEKTVRDRRGRTASMGRLGDAIVRSCVARLSDLSQCIAQRAGRDPMTGLPSRVAIMDRLGDALGRARREGHAVGVLVVDLDGFRSVNDEAGHDRGDAVLRIMGHRLNGLAQAGRSCADPDRGPRSTDRLRFAGRLGDDEFVLVVEDVDGAPGAPAAPGSPGAADRLRRLGERLVAVVQRPVEVDGCTIRLSCSVGGALSGVDHDPGRLLREANSAIDDAKRSGKGRVRMFDREAQRGLERHARIEHDLRRAIVDDEFVLHLQPVIDTASGRVEGAEGLVRWSLPDGSLLPPADFVPVAEDSSLVIELGRLVIAKACAQLAAWDRDGLGHLHLAINVGGRHVNEGDLVGDVRKALTRAGIEAGRLTLELTESNLVTDLERAASVLGELRRIGVGVALDDFGTGYSSLTYLRQLPIDTFKLDRSYVTGLGVDEQETSIVQSLLQLARSLHLDVVAEGVETEAQLEHLRVLGCRWAQGYVFGRPMPAGEFGAWLATR